jgi:predicted RNA-binding Zn-ribbon protein involved in translation (DUF1610 family)
MKTAIKKIRSVELECPYCGQIIYTPSGGSDFWTVEDIEVEQQYNKEEPKCDNCGKKCRLPKVKR